METWDAIRARRNVRTYRPDPVPDGRPGPDRRGRLAGPVGQQPAALELHHRDRPGPAPGAVHRLAGRRHIAGAAAAIALILPQPTDERMKVVDQYDLGQATYAMMLAAADLGVGTGHSSVGDQDRAREILRRPGRPRRGLPDRRRLPRRPAAQADGQAQPPAVRRGRPARSLVGRGEAAPPVRGQATGFRAGRPPGRRRHAPAPPAPAGRRGSRPCRAPRHPAGCSPEHR